MATITSPRTASPAPSSTNTPQITTSSPSSSTRTSLDQTRPQSHPSSTNNGNGGPANPSQRRNRAALRDYYNLKAKPSAVGNLQRIASIASIASTHSDASVATNATLVINETTSAATAQLDDPDFRAEEWVADLLEKSSLRDILRTEAVLVSEIRNLDGERKALVYDNYSKLIKAVGTIGEMQRSMNGPSLAAVEGEIVGRGIGGLSGSGSGSLRGPRGGLERVDELEAKMDGLRGTVRELAGGGERDDKLREARLRRREEKELEKKKKDVVRWVLDAPKRLHALIEAEKEEEAEKEWVVVKGYLDKWQGVKGVDEIRRACEDVLAGSDEEEVVDNSKSGPG